MPMRSHRHGDGTGPACSCAAEDLGSAGKFLKSALLVDSCFANLALTAVQLIETETVKAELAAERTRRMAVQRKLHQV